MRVAIVLARLEVCFLARFQVGEQDLMCVERLPLGLFGDESPCRDWPIRQDQLVRVLRLGGGAVQGVTASFSQAEVNTTP